MPAAATAKSGTEATSRLPSIHHRMLCMPSMEEAETMNMRRLEQTALTTTPLRIRP